MAEEKPAVGEVTVPAVEKAPAADEQASAAEENPPAGEETVLAAEEKPPAGEETLPAAEENPPAGEETVPAAEEKPRAGEETVPAAEEKAPAMQTPEDEDEMDIDRLLDEFDGASPEEQEINQLIRAEMLIQAKIARNASPDTFERGGRIKEQAERRAQREALRKQMREDLAKRKQHVGAGETPSDVVLVAE